MVILHVAFITGNKANGVSIVVPKYAKEQAKYEKVGLLNISDYKITEKIENVKIFNELKMSISSLEKPFNKPDLVVFHEVYRYPFIKIYKELLKENIPYIVIPHGSLNRKAQSYHKVKKIIGNTLLFKKFVKKANKVQFLSEKEKEMSLKFNKNTYILGNGIEIEKEIDFAENKKDTFEFIYIGRFDIKIKGIDVLLKACNENKEFMRKNNIKLSFYGKDSRDKKGRKYINQYIEDNKIKDIVELNSEVYGKEKIQKLINADIYIQTSRTEGQPLSILEALGYGKPVIVTPGTNFAKIVKEEKMGWKALLDKNDISLKMQEAYNESKEKGLETYSNNAKKFIKENFELENITKKALKVYKSIL